MVFLYTRSCAGRRFVVTKEEERYVVPLQNLHVRRTSSLSRRPRRSHTVVRGQFAVATNSLLVVRRHRCAADRSLITQGCSIAVGVHARVCVRRSLIVWLALSVVVLGPKLLSAVQAVACGTLGRAKMALAVWWCSRAQLQTNIWGAHH